METGNKRCTFKEDKMKEERSISALFIGILLGLFLIMVVKLFSSCTAKEIPARHKLSRCIKITEYDYVTRDRKDTINSWTHYYSQFTIGDTIP